VERNNPESLLLHNRSGLLDDVPINTLVSMAGVVRGWPCDLNVLFKQPGELFHFFLCVSSTNRDFVLGNCEPIFKTTVFLLEGDEIPEIPYGDRPDDRHQNSNGVAR
jgi:hypothetical protein